MEVRCMLCGKKEGIGKDHVEYRRLEKNPKAVYICSMCMARTYHEAKEGQKPQKPM